MGRYRKLEEREEEFYVRARDKEDALHLLNERRNQMGIGDQRIPYFIRGRKKRNKVDPVYNNGRLVRNQYGQERVYLDWDIAERTNAFQEFTEWREDETTKQ